jgi:transposase
MTDQEWDCIHDLFPPPARTGRPRRDRRQIVDGILWILRTGAPWRDLPEAFGPWATVWDLFDAWNADGTLDAILSRLRAERIDAGEIDNELWCIDGTSVRAARCTAGGAKKKIPRSPQTTRWGGPAGVFPRRSTCSAMVMAIPSTSA